MTFLTSLLPSFNNPTPHVIPEGENAAPLEVIGCTATDKLVIIMVGVPASGKTFFAKRIARYLTFFLDIPSEIFNVANYRRELVVPSNSDFFDPSNKEAMSLRIQARANAIRDLIQYMRKDGVRTGVFDAANCTKEQRLEIRSKLNEEGIGAKIMFLECICDDHKLIEANIRSISKGSMQDYSDYKDVDEFTVFSDLRNRREQYYLPTYEPVDESERACYVKVYNYITIEVFNVHGYLPLKVVHFVMNLHTLPRTFYIARHGQSEYNRHGKIGGNSGLTRSGVEFARRLHQFAKENIMTETTLVDSTTGTTQPQTVPARLWTSTLRRTKETAQFFDHPTIQHTLENGETIDWVQMRPMHRRNLDEIFAGTMDGMTYKEIEERFPEEFQRRQKDKLSYRYPRGESYMDVILRLEPMACEMERTREPILVIGHQGIHRILYAYFMGLKREEAPYVNIPLNTVIKLTPNAYTCDEERICLMHKEEMMMFSPDGQEEPVTSMPRSLSANITMTSTTLRQQQSKQQTSEEEEGESNSSYPSHKKMYSFDDQIMNAPSH